MVYDMSVRPVLKRRKWLTRKQRGLPPLWIEMRFRSIGIELSLLQAELRDLSICKAVLLRLEQMERENIIAVPLGAEAHDEREAS